MSIATCPKCHRQVSLPTTDDHSVWVRCPLCCGYYSLQMALDHVPPMLEILSPEAVAEMAAHGDVHGETATLAEHAAGLAPALGEDHFPQADHGSNGEQPLDLEHAVPSEQSPGQPPALDQVGGLQPDGTEHLGDFDLDLAEHAEHSEHAEHEDADAAALGEYQGTDHHIEPGEHAGEGDPEFQFSDEESVEDPAEEQHAMGGIATLVQSAPPVKKRRQAPLGVKLVGVLVGLGFGFIGCYLVYGAFLWMHSDQFHLKQFFPAFLRNRVADAPAPIRHPKQPERLSPGSLPAAAPPANTVDNPAATPASQPAPQDNPSNTPAAVPTTGANATAVEPTKPGPTDVATPPPDKPAPNDLAQSAPGKKNAPVETFEDPSKTPPPDLDKTDPSKAGPAGIAPPTFEPPVAPIGDVKPPVIPKPSVDSTETPAPAPDKTVVDKPVTDKPVTDKPVVDKPVVDKPENPSSIPTADKPTEKPADNPAAPPESKSPIAAQLDEVDAAIAATVQAGEKLKTATAPGVEPLTLLRAQASQYKAMSHLATELGAIDGSATDADSSARLEQDRKKAAAIAESMGSADVRNTTAMLAGKWIASQSRKENGAVVVGTLAKVEPSDKGFVVHIKMPSDSSELTFSTAKKPDAADGSTVVVLGLLNADGSGTAIEIVSPNDEKTSVAPTVDPSPKPADADKPAADTPPVDKPAADKPVAPPDTAKPQ